MKYGKLLLISIIVLFTACSQNPYVRDVSDITVDFSILSFQKDIMDLSEHYSEQKRLAMKQKYGTFFESFNSQILKLGVSTDSAYSQKLQSILHEDWIQELFAKSNQVFADTLALYEKLHEELQYYTYYFPDKKIPHICTFIGGVQYSIVIDSNMIAIGIDKYLGPEFEMYKQMEISNFVRKNMHIEKIPGDFARAIVENEFPEPFKEGHLLANMIQNGRYMYFVKCMLPNEPDSLLWGYSAKQLDFCQKSEGEFWKYFVSTNNMLFGSDYMTIRRFIDDGPFTPIFTKESPGKIGQWMGFKIVESFMKNNPDVSIQQLFAIKSAQEIMSKAKYNP